MAQNKQFRYCCFFCIHIAHSSDNSSAFDWWKGVHGSQLLPPALKTYASHRSLFKKWTQLSQLNKAIWLIVNIHKLKEQHYNISKNYVHFISALVSCKPLCTAWP